MDNPHLFFEVLGFMFLVYCVARLLNNWYNLRRYNDFEDKKFNLLDVLLLFVCGALYLISFPATILSFFAHDYTIKYAVQVAKNDSFEHHMKLSKILENERYNEGYEEGKSVGYKIGYERGHEACKEEYTIE